MTHFQKIGVPKQTVLIERTQLLENLKPALNYQMVLLGAPPGCGKTALAVQFAEQVKSHVVWVGITPHEQDLRLFLTHLVTKLMAIVPKIQPVRNSLQRPPEIIANDLVQFLRTELHEPLFIILDDWHLFDLDRQASLWLRAFLSAMPDLCHVFISSRTVPDVDMLTMTSKQQILAMKQQDLYFSRSDVSDLAKKLSQTNDPLIQLVWQNMRGWPAGTVLGLQPSQTHLISQLHADTNPSEAIFQSIARDMVAQQPPHIQQFLKWTSIPENFSALICESVLGLDNWQEALAYVIKQNLFIMQDDAGYRYQQLFRTFLQNLFQLSHPDEFASAHRRMAGWYQTQNQPNQAFFHYIEAREFPKAIQLAESVAYSYFVQGRIHNLRHFFIGLQDQPLLMPHLHHAHAKVLSDYEGDITGSLDAIELALAQFLESDNLVWYLQALQQKANTLLQGGYYHDAIAVSQQILDHPQITELQKGIALSRIGTSYYLLGHLEQAEANLEESISILEEFAGLHDRSIVLQDLELVYRDLGKVDLAQDCLVQLVSFRRQLDNPEKLALALNNLGFRYYEQGLYQQARETYEEGLSVVRLLQSGRARYFLHASMGDLERDCGYFEQARVRYQNALKQVGNQEPNVKAGLLISLAKLYRWQNQAESALTCAQDALTIARDFQLAPLQQEASIAIMMLRLRPDTLRDINTEIAQWETRNPSLELLILRLQVAIYQRDSVLIRQILQTIADRQKKGQSIQSFLAEALHNKVLAQLVREQESRFPMLAKAIGALRAITDADNTTIIPIEAPTHHIHVFSFGSEVIRRDERYLQPSDWQSAIAREIFFYLAFNGATSREKLSDIFWQDRSPEAVSDAFHQTIARIRSAIGGNSVIYDTQTEMYAIQPTIQLTSDAHQFENLIQEARKLDPDSARGFDACYRASQLYSGDFLPSFDRGWIEPRREKYRQMALECQLRLGAYFIAHRDDRSAIQAYEKASDMSRYNEESYRGQMRGWAAMGEIAKVQGVYDRLFDFLRTENHEGPSDVTRNLLRQLTSGFGT